MRISFDEYNLIASRHAVQQYSSLLNPCKGAAYDDDVLCRLERLVGPFMYQSGAPSSSILEVVLYDEVTYPDLELNLFPGHASVHKGSLDSCIMTSSSRFLYPSL